MNREPDNRRTHIGPGHETVRRHICREIRLRIVLHGKGQSAVILRSGAGFHPLRHFLLHHDRDALNRQAVFQKLHQNRRRDVIRQVRHHLDGPAAIRREQCRDIGLHDVAGNDLQVLVILAGVPLKDRNKVPVNLHGHHIACRLAKPLRQRADAGPDFQNHVVFADSGRRNDLLDHVPVNQEILPEFLLEVKIVSL